MKTYDHGYEDSKDSEKSGTGGKNSARSMVLRYIESLSQEQIYRMIDTHTQSRFIKRKDDPTGREIMRRSMEQNGFTIQAKLEISTPEDAHEKQADDLANAVSENNTSKSQNILNEKPADVQTKGEGGSLTTTPEFDQQLSATKGKGQSLDDATKEKLEQHTGTDLSDVKIHTGSTASSMSEGINAKAFTHGQDIYFKNGNYDPKSTEGEKLLSHEVAHTVQQGDGVQAKIQRQTANDTGQDATKIIAKHTKGGVIDAAGVGGDLFWPMTKNREDVIIAVLDILPSAPASKDQFIATFRFMQDMMTYSHVSSSMTAVLAGKLLTILEGYSKSVGLPSWSAVISIVQMTTFLKKKANPSVSDWTVNLDKNTPLDKSTTDSIEKHRNEVTLHKNFIKYKDGYYYYASEPEEKVNINPTELTSEKQPFKNKLNNLVWTELGLEGKSNTFNTWDSEIFTWGYGVSGKSYLDQVLTSLIKSDSGIRQKFIDVGIFYDSTGVLVVDTAPGKERGKVKDKGKGDYPNLKLLQNDLRLLSFFTNLAEDKNSKQNVLDALWGIIRQNAGRIPDYVYTLTKDGGNYNDDWGTDNGLRVRLAIHLSHWLGGGAWSAKGKDLRSYKETKGIPIKIITRFLSAFTGNTGIMPKLSNGASLFTYGPPFRSHFETFANGYGQREIIANSVKVPRSVIESYPIQNIGNYIFVWDDKSSSDSKAPDANYYPIPANLTIDAATSKTNFTDIMAKVGGDKGYSYLFTAFSKLPLKSLEEEKLLKYSSSGWTDLIGKKDAYKDQMTNTIKLGFALASLLRKHSVTSQSYFNSNGNAALRKAVRTDSDVKTIMDSAEYKVLKDGDADKIYVDSFITGTN